MTKIAVCLAGEPRGIHFFHHLNRALFESNDSVQFDFFIYSTNYLTDPFSSKKIFLDPAGTKSALEEIYEPKKIFIEENTEKVLEVTSLKFQNDDLAHFLYSEAEKDGDDEPFRRQIRENKFNQFYASECAFKLKKEFEVENEFSYDYTVRSVFNVCKLSHNCPFLMAPILTKLQTRPNSICCPHSLVYLANGGISVPDFLLFGRNSSMDTLLDGLLENVLDYVIEEQHRQYSMFKDLDIVKDNMFKYYTDGGALWAENIRRKSLSMFFCIEDLHLIGIPFDDLNKIKGCDSDRIISASREALEMRPYRPGDSYHNKDIFHEHNYVSGRYERIATI